MLSNFYFVKGKEEKKRV